MTIAEAQTIPQGHYIFSLDRTYARSNEPAAWKVTSKKLWKTKPGAVRLGIKFGMYEHMYITERDLHLFELSRETAIAAREKRNGAKTIR